jgi:hypothetical protein
MAQTTLAVAPSPWAVLMGIAPVLQIRQMLRQRSSQDVSVSYFVILLVGFALPFFSAAALNSHPFGPLPSNDLRRTLNA